MEVEFGPNKSRQQRQREMKIEPKVIFECDSYKTELLYDETDEEAPTTIIISGPGVMQRYNVMSIKLRTGGEVRNKLVEGLLDHIEYQEG